MWEGGKPLPHGFPDALGFYVSKYSLHRIFTSHPRQFAGFISLPRLYLTGH